MKFKVIITGSTGMVGEGVLHECLLHPEVEQVLVVNRKSCGISHPKLKEVLHNNFFDFTPIEAELKNYSACFFCLGVSSVGMKEKEYYHLTYDLTIHIAQTLSQLNKDMIFCYISGTGTDNTEKGKIMWARVKGKTENDLKKLPFKKIYMFRPGYIHPTKGLKNTLKLYNYFSWLYPVLRLVSPKYVCTLREVGLAMINCVAKGCDKTILEGKDIAMQANV